MSAQRVLLDRERRTIKVMIGIYCRGHHGSSGSLCEECQSLVDYAMRRIDKCPYQDEKPTCAQCPVHCYKSDMRGQVRRVMQYAGPRMLLYHPLLAIRHSLDKTAGKWKRR